jgi:hypothetical protein
MRSRRRSQLTAMVLVAWLGGSGCYHLRVSTAGQPASNRYLKATRHSLFWGLMQQDVRGAMLRCPSEALQEVRVTTNLGFAALTVVSLGIWSPMTVEWKCAREAAPTTPPIARAGWPE